MVENSEPKNGGSVNDEGWEPSFPFVANELIEAMHTFEEELRWAEMVKNPNSMIYKKTYTNAEYHSLKYALEPNSKAE